MKLIGRTTTTTTTTTMAAPNARKTVELFYDVVSPYTWFAFEVLSRYKSRWDIDLKLKPFFLGGIMNESGNKPPAMVPNKGLYLSKELVLLAKYFNVPLRLPADVVDVMFVKGTLSSQRFLTCVDIENQSLTERVSRELWLRSWSRDRADVMFTKGTLTPMRFLTAVDIYFPKFTEPLSFQLWYRIWSRDEDITKPESLKEAGLKAGMNEDQISTCLGKLKDQSIKDRLKQYTDEALSHGAFGSPTIIAHVDNKPVMLFGSDRFPVLAQVLGEKWEGPSPGVDGTKL